MKYLLALLLLTSCWNRESDVVYQTKRINDLEKQLNRLELQLLHMPTDKQISLLEERIDRYNTYQDARIDKVCFK